MIVQIYEIQTPHDAGKCIESGVDHIGSVLLSLDEWRLPELRDTVRLTHGTDSKSSLIPLFHDMDVLSRALDYYRPDIIHLCDSLTTGDGGLMELQPFVEFQSRLKHRFGEIEIMRSVPVPRGDLNPGFSSLDIAAALEPVSDYLLTDTWTGEEPVDGFIGITGRQADPLIAGELVFSSSVPVILAGGLSPENVYPSVTEIVPAGADSCTLTNANDKNGAAVRFRKDFRKVHKFVKEVRRAEQTLLERKKELAAKLENLEAELRERESVLPAHSIRPHQLQAVEALEEEIAEVKKMLSRLPG